MIEIKDEHIKKLEKEIVDFYNDFSGDDYRKGRKLLETRKKFINYYLLDDHQEEILPDIIAFNDALTDALRDMYDRAYRIWDDLKTIRNMGEKVELEAKCFLDYNFADNPTPEEQEKDDLWLALIDDEMNPLYGWTGVSMTTIYIKSDSSKESFDSLIGMDCPPPNWNEGLNWELTKDLHLTSAFHHLFEDTNFALTDFIYKRDFYIDIKIHTTIEHGESADKTNQ